MISVSNSSSFILTMVGVGVHKKKSMDNALESSRIKKNKYRLQKAFTIISAHLFKVRVRLVVDINFLHFTYLFVSFPL